MNNLFFFVPVLNFVLQSYPRLFNPFFGVDVWTRLIEVDHIRKNHHRIPDRPLGGQFIIDGYFDYPPVTPWLFSFIPKKTLLKIQGYIAPFFDSLQVILVYFVAFHITENPMIAVLAQVMYMATPMIAVENSYLTPRSFGYTLFTLTVLPLLLFLGEGQEWYLVVSLVSGVLLFLSHRFAMQAFLFISIFFTFYLNTPLFIQIFLISFVLAIIVTKGYYLRVLKGHIANIYFWCVNLEYRFAHQVRGIIKKDTKTDFVNKIYQLLSLFSPVAIFGLFPWSLSAFILVAGNYYNLFRPPAILFQFAAWIIFLYVLGVIVLKIRRLMPIGEGQRYLEMAPVPSSIIAAYVVFELAGLYGFFVLVLVGVAVLLCVGVIIGIQIKGIIRDRNRSVTGDMLTVFEYINKQKSTLRILCIPHQNTTMTVYHTKAQVFVNADNPGLLKVTEVFPILRMSVQEVAKKYELTHVLIKESFVTLKELGLKEKDVVCASADVKLVKIS